MAEGCKLETSLTGGICQWFRRAFIYSKGNVRELIGEFKEVAAGSETGLPKSPGHSDTAGDRKSPLSSSQVESRWRSQKPWSGPIARHYADQLRSWQKACFRHCIGQSRPELGCLGLVAVTPQTKWRVSGAGCSRRREQPTKAMFQVLRALTVVTKMVTFQVRVRLLRRTAEACQHNMMSWHGVRSGPSQRVLTFSTKLYL